MRQRLIFGVLVATLMGASLAAPAFAHEGESHAKTAVPQSAQAQGVVRSVNASAKTVTIAHDPIAALGWPAMTMQFRVKSADLLKDVAAGARVQFVLVNENGQPVVSELRAAR